jgi:hypothetical protein
MLLAAGSRQRRSQLTNELAQLGVCAAAEDDLRHLALRRHLVPLAKQVIITVVVAAADMPVARRVMAGQKVQHQAVVVLQNRLWGQHWWGWGG